MGSLHFSVFRSSLAEAGLGLLPVWAYLWIMAASYGGSGLCISWAFLYSPQGQR